MYTNALIVSVLTTLARGMSKTSILLRIRGFYLSLERAIDEKDRDLRAIYRRIASLENPRNASMVNAAFENAPGESIALREIAPIERGRKFCFLLLLLKNDNEILLFIGLVG